MKEEWRDIKNFEGFYQASNMGRIRSVDRKVTCKDDRILNIKGKVLSNKAPKNSKKYCNITFSVNNIQTSKDVHRLIAETFIIPKEGCDVVNHIDGDKNNNKVSNLEWTTHTENCRHAMNMGLSPSGGDCSWSKLTNDQVLEIYNLAHNSNMRQYEIADLYDVTKGTVSKIKLGTTGRRLTGHLTEKIKTGLWTKP